MRVVCAFVCAMALAVLGAAPPSVARLGGATSVPEAQETTLSRPAIGLPLEIFEQIDIINAKIKTVIQANHFSKVLVLGAQGPDNKLSEFGLIVGDAVSASLERQAEGFEVVTRDEIRAFLKSLSINPSMALKDEYKDGICAKFGTKAFVLVRIETLDAKKSLVSVFLCKAAVGPSASITGWTFEIPMDAPLREACNSNLATTPVPPSAGITGPRCVHCPRPDYTPQARSAKYQGNVFLAVLVGADGKPEDIVVLKAAPYGISERAVASVKSWKFAPSKNLSGEAVAQYVEVEVTFELH